MKKPILCSLLCAAITLLSSQKASAQIYNAVTPDNVAGSYNSPPAATNLGNAVVQFGSGEIKGMVWDGASPTFAWEFNGVSQSIPIAGAESTGGTVTDPDIVLNPTGGGEFALITYLVDDQVYYEVHEFDAGSNMFNLVVGPAQVNSGTGPCSSPNVDVNENGIAVIVYAQVDPNSSNSQYPFHRIYARTTELDGGPSSLTPVFEYIRYTSQTVSFSKALRPDVAIYGDWVSVVYINDDYGTDKDVYIKQLEVSTVAAGGQNTFGNVDYTYNNPNANDVVGSPRIAAPVQGMALDAKDFQAVVQLNNNIIGLNRYASLSTVMTSAVLNSASNLNSCESLDPVVAYLYDLIIVAWNQKICSAVGGSNTKEILARQLSFAGNPGSSGYSVVNYDRSLTCYQVALDGRYHNTDAFYTFITLDPEEVLYKSSNYSNNNLRIAPAVKPVVTDAEKASVLVYPNPVSENAMVQVTLATGETALMLEAYNIAGKRVAVFNVSGFKEGVNNLPWNSEVVALPAGLYTFKLTTNKASTISKVHKI